MSHYETNDQPTNCPTAGQAEAAPPRWSAEFHDMLAEIRRSAVKLGLKSGFIDDARRAETPYVVDCVGLSDENLPYPIFCEELQRRERWCEQQCRPDYEIEPIREGGRLVGRRFRFADLGKAALFKKRFGTVRLFGRI